MKLLVVLACIIGLSQARCGNEWEAAGTRCSGGSQPGARRLANVLKSRYGGRADSPYNCRYIGGTNRLSPHAEGRAVDFYLTGARGQQVFNDMQNYPGVQEVIFNRQIWTANKGVKRYNGQHPHHDHVHIGLNWCGARA